MPTEAERLRNLARVWLYMVADNSAAAGGCPEPTELEED